MMRWRRRQQSERVGVIDGHRSSVGAARTRRTASAHLEVAQLDVTAREQRVRQDFEDGRTERRWGPSVSSPMRRRAPTHGDRLLTDRGTQKVTLSAGSTFIVPKGVWHRHCRIDRHLIRREVRRGGTSRPSPTIPASSQSERPEPATQLLWARPHGYDLPTRGRGSVVEHHLAKVRVAGSNPVVRSRR